jgi:hypothetical protein
MSSSRIHAGPALPSKGDFLRPAGESGTYHNDSADLTDREAATAWGRSRNARMIPFRASNVRFSSAGPGAAISGQIVVLS